MAQIEPKWAAGHIFPRSAENRPVFGCPCTSIIFSKNDGFSRHYPGSHGTSLTKPANRSLPFLHAGQLGCRKLFISSLISHHTVSCFSQTRRPSSMSSSFLVSVSCASNCLAVSMFCISYCAKPPTVMWHEKYNNRQFTYW